MSVYGVLELSSSPSSLSHMLKVVPSASMDDAVEESSVVSVIPSVVDSDDASLTEDTVEAASVLDDSWVDAVSPTVVDSACSVDSDVSLDDASVASDEIVLADSSEVPVESDGE